jgi:hypothetical protein
VGKSGGISPVPQVHTSHALPPKGIAEASQIFLRDAHVLPKREKYDPEIGCDQTAIGLPPVTSAVLLIAKSF